MFRTAHGQRIEIAEIAQRIAKNMPADPHAEYEITVGTDSQNFHETKMVEVVAIHKKGYGGTYFYNIEFIPRITNLRQKINEETSRSLTVANSILEPLEECLFAQGKLLDDLNVSFQIHCDIGQVGKTNTLIKEITSWVTSQGYICLIKPDSYAASGIANKYSK